MSEGRGRGGGEGLGRGGRAVFVENIPLSRWGVVEEGVVYWRVCGEFKPEIHAYKKLM